MIDSVFKQRRSILKLKIAKEKEYMEIKPLKLMNTVIEIPNTSPDY